MPRRRKTGISFFGIAKSSTMGLSLLGFGATVTTMITSSTSDTSESSKSVAYITEYNAIKTFINDVFMNFLIKRDAITLRENAFNFDSIVTKLKNFTMIFEDANIWIKFIETVKISIEIIEENNELYDRVYGALKESTLMYRTSAVELRPEIQLYVDFWGTPEHFSEFDHNKLGIIRSILEKNVTSTFAEVKQKLGIKKTFREIEEAKKKEEERKIEEAKAPEKAREERRLARRGIIKKPEEKTEEKTEEETKEDAEPDEAWKKSSYFQRHKDAK